MFHKVNPARAFEEVAEQIRQAIVSGQLQPGERLPAQRELAPMFGVGRPTLLEAMRILENSGLVVMRLGAGGGAFVTAPSLEQVSRSLDLLLQREGTSMEEVQQFREDVEGRCAYRAAQRTSEEELAAVECLFRELQEYRGTPGSTWFAFIDREVHFHLAVANLSGNRVHVAVLRAIHATMDRIVRYGAPSSYGDRILKDWQNILEAIRTHRAAEAEILVKQHVSFFHEIAIANARRMTPSEAAGETRAPVGGAPRAV